MSNLATTGYDTFDGGRDAPSGRHALSEDAVLTPIFHALARGRGRERRPEPVAPVSADPVETFRQNPLTAPIPLQALLAVPSQPAHSSHSGPPSQPWRRDLGEPKPTRSGRRRAGRGRHHHRLEVVGY